ncbi:hypothetical protein K1T71_014798 [Dendrolimus kikuchii]|nr:hypothetical protein K1T71_014798 [Dendrolimus kikuchii]
MRTYIIFRIVATGAETLGNNDIQVHRVENGPGIYFDPKGSVKIINGQLNIIIPIDISFIYPHLNNIRDTLNTVSNLCNHSKTFKSLECENILQPLEVRFVDMVRDYNAISHLVPRRTRRSAWFGAVGTVFKNLFGTMNEDDAIQYNRAIKELQEGQTDLAHYVKQGILLTSSTLNTFNKSITHLINNEESLNNIVGASETLTIKVKIMEIVTILENSILTLSFKLEDISNDLMFSKNNVLYPAIYSPKELFDNLNTNYRFLPSSKELPVPLEINNVHILMELSNINSFYVDGKIVFVVKIPLVNPLDFNLYHVLPLPILLNNDTYIMIVPNTIYIGFSRDKAQYCHIENIRNCKSVGQNYICDKTYVLSSVVHPTCESEIVSKTISGLPTVCPTKLISGNIEIWQELEENRWIFVISRKSKFTLDCPDENVQETNVFGSGIIEIPIGCTGYCRGIELQSKEIVKINVTRVNVDFNIIKMYNISEPQLLNTTSIPKLNIKSSNFESLLKHKESFDSLNNKLENFIKRPQATTYQHFYIPTVIYCILIISLILGYKYYKYCKVRSCDVSISPSSDATPEPAPTEIELTSAPRLRINP